MTELKKFKFWVDVSHIRKIRGPKLLCKLEGRSSTLDSVFIEVPALTLNNESFRGGHIWANLTNNKPFLECTPNLLPFGSKVPSRLASEVFVALAEDIVAMLPTIEGLIDVLVTHATSIAIEELHASHVEISQLEGKLATARREASQTKEMLLALEAGITSNQRLLLDALLKCGHTHSDAFAAARLLS